MGPRTDSHGRGQAGQAAEPLGDKSGAEVRFSALVEQMAGGDIEQAAQASRDLSRARERGAAFAMARFETAAAPLRGRLCAVLGRIAQRNPESRSFEFLLSALADADDKTRRNAAIALGKIARPETEHALLACWQRESSAPMRRTLAAALGKIGKAQSLNLLRSVQSDDVETSRIISEARLKLERTELRNQDSSIDASIGAAEPIGIVFHCRTGLEQLLETELHETWQARARGPGRLLAQLIGPLSRVFESRIMTQFGFVLPPQSTGVESSLESAVVRALTSDTAICIMKTWTRGPIRYRLNWTQAGHRRALTYRCARAISAVCPELVNDPTRSIWEALISENQTDVRVELWPRSLEDPRFRHRVRVLPAASHPTIAAALARVGGVKKDDVVWDPFVGSGLELVERALLGPYRLLVGTDIDGRALYAARENLKAAGITRFELIESDARKFVPRGPVHLIITNPPLGRRVLHGADLLALYAGLIERSARVLVPGGRLVWISPVFERSVNLARDAGMSCVLRRRVDMGGFQAELQAFSARKGRASRHA